MNLYVGEHDLTADKDYKHVVKRLRNLLLRKMGAMVNGVHITPALLRFHLKENKVSTHRLNYLLNPQDRQNVPLCYSLLKEVWSLPDPSPSDKPGFVVARRALQLLGALFRHIVLPFIQINLSLHDQLAHLSTAAHLATFLYSAKGKSSGTTVQCRAIPCKYREVQCKYRALQCENRVPPVRVPCPLQCEYSALPREHRAWLTVLHGVQ
jgi:hypothetical protein